MFATGAMSAPAVAAAAAIYIYDWHSLPYAAPHLVLVLQSAQSSDAFVAIVNPTQLCRLACSSCTSPLSCTRVPPPADRLTAPCKAPRRQTRNRGATSWCATAPVLISESLNIAVAQVTAWCSQCCRYGDHMMTERSTVVRCAYRCMHCEDRTLPCRNECGAMARGHWW